MKSLLISAVALLLIATCACRKLNSHHRYNEEETADNSDAESSATSDDNVNDIDLPTHLRQTSFYKTADASINNDGYDCQGYEKHVFYINIGQKLMSFPKYKSYLIDIYKHINDTDVPVDKAIKTFLSTPIDNTLSFRQCDSIESRIGLVNNGVIIYPALSNNKMVEICILKYLDGASGFGASYSEKETSRIYLQSPTSWCPTGIIDPDKILRRGPSDTREILAMLVNKFHSMQNSDEGQCFSDEPTRVPETIRIGPKGISFIFQKYEIACGAAENAEITLSYQQLKAHINPDFYHFITSCTGWIEYNRPSVYYD